MQCNGVDSGSISLSTPWISAEANFELARKTSQSSSKVKSYLIKRHLNTKLQLFTDPAKLICDNDFATAVKNAVHGNETSIVGYRNLVHVLNEYGWYVPLKFTVGGAIYSTKISEVGSIAETQSEMTKFGGKVEAAIANFGAKAEYNKESSSESKDEHKKGDDSITFEQIGGSGFAHENLSMWYEALNDAKNWTIIGYQKMLLSLMLLRSKDDTTLKSCLELVLKYRFSDASLQKYLNVGDYMLRIANELPGIVTITIPNLIGKKTNSLKGRRIECRVLLSENITQQKFEPILLEHLLPSNESSTFTASNNVVVCQEDTAIAFDIVTKDIRDILFDVTVQPVALNSVFYIRGFVQSNRALYNTTTGGQNIIINSTESFNIQPNMSVNYQHVLIKLTPSNRTIPQYTALSGEISILFILFKTKQDAEKAILW